MVIQRIGPCFRVLSRRCEYADGGAAALRLHREHSLDGEQFHVRPFYTQLEVEKAMALNGSRMCGHYIGVVRCNKEEVGEVAESELNKNRSSYMDRRCALA